MKQSNIIVDLDLEFLWFLNQDKVLKPLGAVTSGSQFLEPDGNSLIFSSFN
jgi:hypothetical protein